MWEQSLAGVGADLDCSPARIAGFSSLNFVEEFAKPRAGLVQLRLRNTHRAPQSLGNFVVLISFDIVQDEYGAVARGQPFDAAVDIYSVNRSLQQQVRCPKIDRWPASFIVWVGMR